MWSPSLTAEVCSQWQTWIMDNLQRNVEPADLLAHLTDAGLDRGQALHLLLGGLDQIAQQRLHRARRAEQVLSLRRSLRPTKLAAQCELEPRRFWAQHWETQTPAWFRGVIAKWTDLQCWTPQAIAQRYGEVDVEYHRALESGERSELQPDRTRCRGRLRDYVRAVLEAPSGNGLYMVANNRNLQHTQLSELLTELDPPAGLFATKALSSGAALWLGPSGTVTRLHHDQSSILLCQMYGHKSLTLAAPDEVYLLEHSQGLYANVDLTRGRPTQVQWYDVTLGPGDALFIPVGWWHFARSTSISVSLALNAFSRPNSFPTLLLGR